MQYEKILASVQNTSKQKIDLLEIGTVNKEGTKVIHALKLRKWQYKKVNDMDLASVFNIGLPLEQLDNLARLISETAAKILAPQPEVAAPEVRHEAYVPDREERAA